MKNAIIKGGKMKAQKGGCCGNEMWSAHRLEGKVKNKAITMVKKPKKVIKKIENPLDKKITKFLN